jgi:hypothetical protein
MPPPRTHPPVDERGGAEPEENGRQWHAEFQQQCARHDARGDESVPIHHRVPEDKLSGHVNAS